MRLIDADAIPEVSWDQKEEAAFRATINKMPTIEAEPVRRGRWETDTIHSNWTDCTVRTCTACGGKFETSDKWKYCPNCGAKMEGEE